MAKLLKICSRAILALVSVLGAAAAAEEDNFELRDYLNRTWSNECVRFRLNDTQWQTAGQGRVYGHTRKQTRSFFAVPEVVCHRISPFFAVPEVVCHRISVTVSLHPAPQDCFVNVPETTDPALVPRGA